MKCLQITAGIVMLICVYEKKFNSISDLVHSVKGNIVTYLEQSKQKKNSKIMSRRENGPT